MNQLTLLLLCCTVSYMCAVRLPYLGGDIQDLIEQAKRSDLLITKHHKQPHVAFSEIPIKLRTQEERDRISRLNARARHRNTYFDGVGGNPFNGGGVLSRQNAITKKHRRRRRSTYSYDRPVYGGSYYDRGNYDRYYYDNGYLLPMMIRQRRGSSMPYLGQNLDNMGVIRAIPRSWAPPLQKKSKQTKKANTPEPEPMFPGFSRAPVTGMEMKPGMFNSWMSPSFRATIPQPMPMPMSMPYAMAYGQVMPNQQNQLYPEFRSMIPSIPPAYYSQMAAAMSQYKPLFSPPMGSYLTEKTPGVEQSKASTETVKKSAIPERPDTITESAATAAVTGNDASSLTGNPLLGSSASPVALSTPLSAENGAATFERSSIPASIPIPTNLPGNLPGNSASSFTAGSMSDANAPASSLPGSLPGNSGASFVGDVNVAPGNPGTSRFPGNVPGNTASSFAGGNIPGNSASSMAGSVLAGSSVPGSNPVANNNDEMRWVTPQ